MHAASNPSDPEALEVVDMLVQAMGPDRAVNYLCVRKGARVMHTATKFGRLDIVRLLFEKYGAPPPWPPSALFAAVYGGHLPVLQYLVKVQCMPVDVRFRTMAPDEEGEVELERGVVLLGSTPLLLAVAIKRFAEDKMLAIVRWLVEEAGADTKLCDAKGRTPAEVARLQKNFQIERYLLRDEKEAQAAAAASALLAELQIEEEAGKEGGYNKSKKARKKEKKRDKETKREVEEQMKKEEQRERERQEQDDRLRQ